MADVLRENYMSHLYLKHTIMKKISILFFILLGVGTVFATNSDPQIGQSEAVDADCAISLNFTNVNFPGSDMVIELNGEEVYRVDRGVLQGPAIVNRTVPQGSKAELAFWVYLQDNPEYGFYLFINNVRQARLNEFTNHYYTYEINTFGASAPVNFYMLYEP